MIEDGRSLHWTVMLVLSIGLLASTFFRLYQSTFISQDARTPFSVVSGNDSNISVLFSSLESDVVGVFSSEQNNASSYSEADTYEPSLRRRAQRLAQLYKLKIAPSFPEKNQRENGSYLVDLSSGVVRHLNRFDISPVDNSTIDVSLVMCGTLNRKILLPIILKQWKGPAVFVFHIKDEELSVFRDFISQTKELCTSRVTILGYVSTAGSFFHDNYPINILRNIGIHHARTTHFVLLDIDMIPSDTSYEELKTAVIVPSFFNANWSLPNGTFEFQVHEVMKRIPLNISSLVTCSIARKCLPMKVHLFTHLYLQRSWIAKHVKGEPVDYIPMNCWPNRYQEPYVMVKRRDNVTEYLEDLINYGYNKITYIENLRYRGYRFVVAGKMFAFDLPHTPSKFHDEHINYRINSNYFAYVEYMYKLEKVKNQTGDMLPICEKK